MTQIIEERNLSFWNVTSFRFTSFPPPNYPFNIEWWENIIGNPPDSITQHPKFLTQRYEGTFQSGTLLIQIEPTRFDIIYSADNKPETFKPELLNLGEFPQVLAIFSDLILKFFLLKNFPSTQRVAFGATLVSSVESRKEGYEKLATFLKYLKIDTIHSSELAYQINRPRKSETFNSELIINRLSKWSVLLSQFYIKPSLVSTMQKIEKEDLFIHLDLDINTQATFDGIFSPEVQKLLFEELISLGSEIALKGDIQ